MAKEQEVVGKFITTEKAEHVLKRGAEPYKAKPGGVWLKCRNKRCGNIWLSHTRQKWSVSCSNCRWQVSLTNPDCRPTAEEIEKAKEAKEK